MCHSYFVNKLKSFHDDFVTTDIMRFRRSETQENKSFVKWERMHSEQSKFEGVAHNTGREDISEKTDNQEKNRFHKNKIRIIIKKCSSVILIVIEKRLLDYVLRIRRIVRKVSVCDDCLEVKCAKKRRSQRNIWCQRRDEISGVVFRNVSSRHPKKIVRVSWRLKEDWICCSALERRAW